jgi:ribose transport system permease protein
VVTAEAPARPAGGTSRLRGVPLSGLVPYALVPVLFLLCAATIDGYLTKSSVISLLVLTSMLGLASLGQTMTIIAGGADLSIPAVIGLAEILTTKLYAQGWPFVSVVLLLVVLAVVIGTANAIASVLLRVHPLITTFGMNLVVSGIALELSHGLTAGKVPAWLTRSVAVIGTTGPIPVPGVVLVWVLASVLGILFLRHTRLGREIYATGANPVAARLARVRTTWVLVVVFVISALFAALVGILFAGFSGTADPTIGQPYFFQTITAVIIGGTSLLGGRGGYGRTIAGAFIVTELTTLLVGNGFGASMQEVLLGVLVIVLVIAYGREAHVSAKV